MGSCSSRSRRYDATLVSSVDYPLLLEGERQRRRRRRRFPEQQQIEDAEEARLAEIMALQQSLAAMEDFFQSLLGQASFFEEAFDPQNTGGGPGQGPPPAARHVLESLKDLSIQEENGCGGNCQLSQNMTVLCGICGEECHPADSTRLPCGHAFHREQCIKPWLSRHCTCPICRYEFPTDDESYEPGRVERMSVRKKPEIEEKMEQVRTLSPDNEENSN